MVLEEKEDMLDSGVFDLLSGLDSEIGLDGGGAE
jgi:hypothetical protein